MISRLAHELLAFYLRRTPIERGRWRLIPLALQWSRKAQPSDRTQVIRTRDGYYMHVTLGDWEGRHLHATGEYEPATTRWVKQLLRRGDTFIDIGANIGYFSLLAAQLVGPTGSVIAFEPVPVTKQALLDNIRLNRADNVVVREEAISDGPGDATFFVGPENHRGTSSLRPLDNASQTLHVRKVRLDSIVHADQPVRLMKIDVEGAEYLALLGAEGVLRRDKPDLIIEMTDSYLAPMGHSSVGISEYLRGFGYRMYVIEHNGLKPAVPGQDALPDQYNALFTARPDPRP